MEIYLVRHIEPLIEKGICYGQLDVPIPKDYKIKHENIKKELPFTFDHVFSSPLTRCLWLAHSFTDTVNEDARLMEVNFGDWEGKKWDELPSLELKTWMENYIELAPPNGESLKQLVDRFADFTRALKKETYTRVLVITHAGIIRAAKHVFNGMPLTEVMMTPADYGSVHRFELET